MITATRANAAKPRLATLMDEPRILELVALADEPLVHRDGEGNGVTVIYKNPDMTEGLSDIRIRATVFEGEVAPLP